VILSRELANFLIELAIGVHKYSVYPPEHPFLAHSADAVASRLAALFEHSSTLSFGVARRQLVIEGVATDAENPVLSGLAGRLHRHHVGAVTLLRDVSREEITQFLRVLSAESDQTPSAAGGGSLLDGWPSIRLHSLSYAQLELTGGEDIPADSDRESAVRSAQLWVGLARAALAREDDPSPPPSEPVVVARAIDEHPRALAYDQVIVGYLLQLAEELKRAESASEVEVRRRLSEMISALHPSTLQRLVEMGGDAVQRHRFVLDASYGLATEAVIQIVEAAATASSQTLSHALVRLLSKLALHADQEASPVSAAADTALRDQVRLLIAGWELPDPNPGMYTRAMDAIARTATGTVGILPGPNDPEPARLVQTALEIDAGGTTVWSAVERMVMTNQLPVLIGMLASTPPGVSFAEAVWSYVATPHHLRQLLRTSPDDAASLDVLQGRMKEEEVVAALLDEMAGSESRAVRRVAFDRLARIGPPVASHAVARLEDPRWYVQRNLLALLAEVGAPPGFSPASLTRHPDVRVRREAFRLWLSTPGERTRSLATALVEEDQQTLRAALAEVQAGCPPQAVPLLCRRIGEGHLPAELRVLAIRALRTVPDPLALQTLLRVLDGGRNWLGRRRIAPRSPEVLAALRVLAGTWRSHPAAAALLSSAGRSGDPEFASAIAVPGERP
jgi:hypothetical protein